MFVSVLTASYSDVFKLYATNGTECRFTIQYTIYEVRHTLLCVLCVVDRLGIGARNEWKEVSDKWRCSHVLATPYGPDIFKMINVIVLVRACCCYEHTGTGCVEVCYVGDVACFGVRARLPLPQITCAQ